MPQYLADNLVYPETARQNNIEGRVVVKFAVAEDGTITDAAITRSVHLKLDEEAIRVVLAMPKWTPGIQNDELVKVYFSVPIVFKLK